MPATHRPSFGPRVGASLVGLALVIGAVAPALAPPPTRAATAVFINELHYDNTGADTGEFVEIAGPAGTPLTGWSLVPYNGAGGGTYTPTVNMTGTIPDQDGGFGTRSFPIVGLQNGSPDGIALVNGTTVVQFLSYEGTFTATSGPASGTTSTDIGVSQNGTEPIGSSLHLVGTGSFYEDFTWATTANGTPGAVNGGQAFGQNAAVVALCGSTLEATDGHAAQRTITASDADGTVTQISIDPATAVDGITIGATTPEGASPARATVTVAGTTAPGTYAIGIVATNDDAVPQVGTCTLTVLVAPLLTIGEVQGSVADDDDGPTHRSAFAPATGNGNGQTVAVRGVVTQLLDFRAFNTAINDFDTRHGFFLQSTTGAGGGTDTADGDPTSSDGIFVFMNFFETLRVDGGGSYTPQAGDDVVLRGPVVEFFNLTQLGNPFVSEVVRSGADLATEVEWTEADPPSDLADASRFWERHEAMQHLLPAGAAITAGRDVFASTADGEMWALHPDSPLLDRANPFARRVFRDPHPLDDVGPAGSFDNGNGQRIMLQSHALKALSGDDTTLIVPSRTFDTITNELRGGLYFAFEKYGIEVASQPALASGADPSTNSPPAEPEREVEYSTATYNVENLYDFRDDPNDGCDFADDEGCPGVQPPFDYVPASDADYRAHLEALADQIATDLHAPDIVLVQEAEDQDICSVAGAELTCGTGDNADGRPDTLQELALVLASTHGVVYDAALDRDGADDRGIVSGFLYRTDRVELLAPSEDDPVLGSAPEVVYPGTALPYNAEVQNPKALNAQLPADVALGDPCDELPDGRCVFTRDPQVGLFRVWRDGIGSSVFTDVYAISNHFSSTPDDRVAQRTEQATYDAAIAEALDGSRVVVGGDFNVFPRPDDPFPPPDTSDQLAALYDAGLRSLWEVVAAAAPAAAYSYVFDGQAQTLDNQFTTAELFEDLNGVRYAHVNADWPAAHEGDGSRGASDHDPQAARFDTEVTIERLRDLLDFYVGTGQVTPDAREPLLALLAAAERSYDRGNDAQGDAKMNAFISVVTAQTPSEIDPDASDALREEARRLIEAT